MSCGILLVTAINRVDRVVRGPIVKSFRRHLLREALIAGNRLQCNGNSRRAPALRIWGLNLFSSLLLLHSLLHLLPSSILYLLHPRLVSTSAPPTSILDPLPPPSPSRLYFCSTYFHPRSSISSILASSLFLLHLPPSSIFYLPHPYLPHPYLASIPRPQIRASVVRFGRGGPVGRRARSFALGEAARSGGVPGRSLWARRSGRAACPVVRFGRGGPVGRSARSFAPGEAARSGGMPGRPLRARRPGRRRARSFALGEAARSGGVPGRSLRARRPGRAACPVVRSGRGGPGRRRARSFALGEAARAGGVPGRSGGLSCRGGRARARRIPGNAGQTS